MTKLNWMTKACGVFLLWAMPAIALPAQTFATLYSFGAPPDGATPYAGLIQGTDGNLYGTTESGGTQNDGTVFSITPSGTVTVLHSFCSLSKCADGYEPYGGLVQATDGDLYGTTYYGGSNSTCPFNSGCGTVFKITSSGKLTTLYSFGFTDGANPYAGLVQGTNGTFYGTNVGGATGYGAVFSITPSGTLTTLHSFCPDPPEGCPDGATPYGGLIQATNGDLYGTTYRGGAYAFGEVYEITPSGTLTTLHSFCTLGQCADGSSPYGGLVQGTNRDFYGTTAFGGTGMGDGGTVFKIAPSGKLTTLYNFCSQTDCTDGESPYAGLIQGTDGNFYGTTPIGGANGNVCGIHDNSCGTVFKITPSGMMTILRSFDGTDGWAPYGGLVQATNGEFYGTTEYGGAVDDFGTVFSLNAGLSQFVETLPTSGKVGAHIKILGSFLTGATSVTFNGTAATFTIISKSEILTTVPTAATTGTVQVISPRLGTLSSNVPFTVRP